MRSTESYGRRVANDFTERYPARLTPIDQDYEHLRTDMATLFRHLGLARPSRGIALRKTKLLEIMESQA